MPWPLSLPLPTAIYFGLYLSTLSLHVLFMSYVFGGSAYLLGTHLGVVPRRWTWPDGGDQPNPIAEQLRDWLPLALSAAITAGIGPLLFLQLLYQQAFYTANLLLMGRWMLIVPVLILAAYALYILKASRTASHPLWRLLASVVAFGSFAFVAWSWTENHLLSLAGVRVWKHLYATGQHHYTAAAVLPRWSMWFGGSLPLASVVLLGQLRRRLRPLQSADPTTALRVRNRAQRHLASMALGGLLVAALAFVAYHKMDADLAAFAWMRGAARPFACLLTAGLAVQVLGWLWLLFDRRACRLMVALTLSAATVVASVALLRELWRWGRFAPPAQARLLAAHAEAWELGGVTAPLVFLAALLLMTVVMLKLWGLVRSVTADRRV